MIFSAAVKDEMGHVVVGPRNFTTMGLKKGHTDKELFSRPSYVCTGDLYKSRSVMQLRTTSNDGHLKAGHLAPFRPTKAPQIKDHKAPYEHMNERTEVKKNYRDADGHVIIKSRNIITNGLKSGEVGKQTYFSGIPPHMPDDYESGRKLARQEFEAAQAKMQEKPFS